MIFYFFLFFQINVEILVNDDTIGGIAQKFPAVAIDSFSNFYVVWTDGRCSDYDSDIYLQKFDSLGNIIGRNRNLIEDEPSRNIWRYTNGPADIAIDKDKIVVVYCDRRRGDFDVYCQFFDLNLNLLSPMILLNHDFSNSYQDRPKVAISKKHYIFVWEDWREGIRTIYGQILDSNFNFLSQNFRISEIREYEQFNPSISANQNSFIITWTQRIGHNNYLYGRRFATNGTPLGNSFFVFPFPAKNPFCAMDENGHFFVCGEEENTPFRSVYLTLFDANNNRIVTPKIINDSFPINWERQPSIAILPSRKKGIIVWCDTRAGCKIYAQFIDSMGDRIGNNFPVSNFSVGQATPKVAILSESSYFITWEDSRENNPDIYSFHPRKNDFKVNDDFASAIQDFPCVGIDEEGNSFVVWYDHRNGDPWDIDIYGQYFDNSGNKIGENFRINDDGIGNNQVFPWVSMNKSGRAVVVWYDNRNGSCNVYCQIFDEQRNRVGENIKVSVNPVPHTGPSFFVSINDSGDFIITWHRIDELAPYCQLYRKNGEPISNNFRISEKGYLPFPYLNNDKSFWIVWDDGYIYLRKFDSLYQPLTPPIRVSTTTRVKYPFMIKDKNGIVWVAWMDNRGSDYEFEIFGRRCNENGLIGEEIKINDDNIICEHWFPVWGYDGDTTLYVTFTDFREEGNINVMAQKFHISGRRIGRNYSIHTDPYPSVHQWAWGSVAASRNYVAYTWIDNRNLRSWDIYFKLVSMSRLAEDSSKIRVLPTYLKREELKNLKKYLPYADIKEIKVFDKKGCLLTENNLIKLSSGIYFLKIEREKGAMIKKLIIL